jgi:broad specificity phosphatase PhoE
MAAWLSLAAAALADSRLLLIRHGRTEMNDHLATPDRQWGARDFVDPGLWDTELTPFGRQQARQLGERFAAAAPRVDVLCTSPLRRALHTAELVFDGAVGARVGRRLVTPLAAERLLLSSDVGSPLAELLRRFSRAWRLDEAVCEGWWYQGMDNEPEWRPPGTYLVRGEPQHAFTKRMSALIQKLRALADETISGEGACIALVTHAEVIHALTGKSVNNCECLELRLSELPNVPYERA